MTAANSRSEAEFWIDLAVLLSAPDAAFASLEGVSDCPRVSRAADQPSAVAPAEMPQIKAISAPSMLRA
ncbi:MAG: hypothetical protein AAGL10_00840 [Pseudomonadota bacterium]